jgi:hypothetical protein
MLYLTHMRECNTAVYYFSFLLLLLRPLRSPFCFRAAREAEFEARHLYQYTKQRSYNNISAAYSHEHRSYASFLRSAETRISSRLQEQTKKFR